MEKPFYIVTKNYNQFMGFIQEHRLNKHDFKYIELPEKLHGCRNGTLIQVYEWHLSKYCVDIMEMAKHLNIAIVSEREFINYIANQNVTPGNQPPVDDPIKEYPVSEDTFNFLKQVVEFKQTRVSNGVKFYLIEQMHKSSGVEAKFWIYKHEYLDTKMTEIYSIPIEKNDKK